MDVNSLKQSAMVGEHIDNRLIAVKPDCKLIGEDGNVFNLMGIASKTLKRNGLDDQAKEMTNRIFNCDSYDEALSIIGEYVNII